MLGRNFVSSIKRLYNILVLIKKLNMLYKLVHFKIKEHISFSKLRRNYSQNIKNHSVLERHYNVESPLQFSSPNRVMNYL